MRKNTKYRKSMTGAGTAHQQHEVTVALFWMDLRETATCGESKTGLVKNQKVVESEFFIRQR